MSNNLISTHAKSFSWAGFFLAKQTFKNGSSLYDFCRTLDDIADDTDQLEIKRDNFLLPLEVTRKLFSFETKENDIFSLILDNGDAYVVKLDKVNDNKGVISTKDLNEGKNYLSSVYKEIIRQSFTAKLRESSTFN